MVCCRILPTRAELATLRPSPAAADTPFRATWAGRFPGTPWLPLRFASLRDTRFLQYPACGGYPEVNHLSHGIKWASGLSMQHVVALIVEIAVAVTLTVDDRDTTLPYAPSANCIYLLYNLAPAGVGGPFGRLQHNTHEESLESPEATLRDYAAWSLVTV